MKKYLLIGGGVLMLAVIAGAALFGDTQQETPATTSKTTVSSSTTETPIDDIDQDESTSSNSADAQQKDDDETAAKPKLSKKAAYVDFSRSAFKERAGVNRVLFFYDKSHAPSTKLDNLLRTHISEFPDNLAIFKTTLSAEAELAKSLAVTSPGTALKYDAKNNLVGIYITNDAPDIATFRAALQIDK